MKEETEMGIGAVVQAAIDDNGTGVGLAAAAIAGVREFVRRDVHTAHAVAQFTSLRQAASETPIEFVRRIVGAYLTEAIEMESGADADDADTADIHADVVPA